MNNLARWSMQSRMNATLAISACFAIPLLFWIGAALVALVLMRQGWKESAQVVLWSALPAIGWFAAGDPTPLLVALGTVITALVLRASIRLEIAMLVATLVGVVFYQVLPLLLPDVLPPVVERIQQELSKALVDEPEFLILVQTLTGPLTEGVLAALHVLVLALCLLLGRYWQALLFNPGGFGREFQTLRLPLGFTLPVLLAVMSAGQLAPGLVGVLPLLTVPLFLAGLAMFHGVVSITTTSSNWMFPIYIGLVLFVPYMYTLLIFVAVVDSLMDIRARLKDTAPGDE
ncbi:MAG: hypothetical protein K6L60_09205 [Oceanobacter sp.]